MFTDIFSWNSQILTEPQKYVNCQLLGPNPRKYHVCEMEFSSISENIKSAKMSCPTVGTQTSYLLKSTNVYEAINGNLLSSFKNVFVLINKPYGEM